MTTDLRHGDSRDVLKTLPDNSIDSCVTDPPYALQSIVKRFGGDNAAPAKHGTDGAFKRASAGFMGKKWDTGECAFDPSFWTEVMRVMKPGAHLFAFSSTRTYHRLAVAIEDAGFVIRDQFAWVYGSGFPKSHNIGNGWGTAVKPAWEPICLAQKPVEGTIAGNVLKHGVGGLNIDGCRIGTEQTTTVRSGHSGDNGIYGADDRSFSRLNPPGRFPANLAHDGSDEVLACFPDSDGQQGDVRGTEPSSVTAGIYGKFLGRLASQARNDAGSAARFFYTAKADADDRWGSKHPTVKPIDLIRYYARMITPPGGLILDPFAGSGTLGVAAMAEGFNSVLIEREDEYVADIRERIAFYEGEGRHSMASKNRNARPNESDDGPLIALMKS